MSQGRPTVFTRIGKDRAPTLSVFQRLKRDSQLKSSVFTRIAKGKNLSGSSPAQVESSVLNHLGEASEVQSLIPSHIKRISMMDAKIDGSLKIKRRTLVITNYDASLNLKDKIEEEDQVSSNHITIREVDDLEIKVEPAEGQQPWRMEGKLQSMSSKN